jgi:hypothetical protein
VQLIHYREIMLRPTRDSGRQREEGESCREFVLLKVNLTDIVRGMLLGIVFVFFSDFSLFVSLILSCLLSCRFGSR